MHQEWERLNAQLETGLEQETDNLERLEEEMLDEGLGFNNLRLGDNDEDVTEEDILGEEEP